MKRPLLEVCVDSRESAMAAIRGGADRVELCTALSEGGLTPSAGFMREAASWPVPVYTMIRPRGGDFVFSDSEAAIMEEDIAMARSAGLAGIVTGAARPDKWLDTSLLRRLAKAAGPMGITLHRVVDTLHDPVASVDKAVEIGFERILTSGGSNDAPHGAEVIKRMVGRAASRITIMPGAGLTPRNVRSLVSKTGVREVHSSCTPPDASAPKTTREDIVRTMIEALEVEPSL